ncbi:HNH endonuclease [Pseudomonas corrugata]|uniref:HNH endonuclease n=1 Tax=Pseudomonas corrugata TaxID=47879 RepID=UPI0022345FAF|nr:hypothetical protein [Pseudomonas corrugata]UZE07032.1 hypothetical protein LOY65_03625 [Pseudomonas corrugata]
MYKDPLHPALSGFIISAEEQAAVDFALTLDDSWKLEQEAMEPVRGILKSLKDRIRAFHLQRQAGLCCYCRDPLPNDSGILVDREHIIPKSHLKILTYVMTNLSVACKRCNMEIKKNKLAILEDPASIEANHLNESAYRIIHPNFEDFEQFIVRKQEQEGKAVLVKFITKLDCDKTSFTLNFFKLRDLERNTFDAAQGIPVPTAEQSLVAHALEAEVNNQPALAQHIVHMLGEGPEEEGRASEMVEYNLVGGKRNVPETHRLTTSYLLSRSQKKHTPKDPLAHLEAPLLRLPAPKT